MIKIIITLRAFAVGTLFLAIVTTGAVFAETSLKKAINNTSTKYQTFQDSNKSTCIQDVNCVKGSIWSPSACQCVKVSSLTTGEACAQESKCDEEHGYFFSNQTCQCAYMEKPEVTEEESPSSGGGSCVSRYEAELNECRTESASAYQNCDAEKDSGITQAKNGLSNAAVGLGQQMGAQGNSAETGAMGLIGAKAACSNFGKALGAANGAIAAFSQVCSSAKNSCLSKCLSLKQALDRELSKPTDECIGTNTHVALKLSRLMETAIDEVDTCRGLEAKVQQGVAAVNNLKGSIDGAMNCAEQLDTTLLYCKQNPNALACSPMATMATDCSNPSIAASSPICICARNPNDPACNVSTKASSGRGGATDLASSAGLTGGSAGGGGIDSGLDNVDWQGREWKKSNDTAEDPGGSKGGRPIQEGSAGNRGGAGNGSGGGDPNAVSVNSGFRGAGGGSGGGGGFYGGEGGRGGVAGKAGGAANSKYPDLRNFLPGGKFDPRARGIAGISGPDGITGPHSNIWQKIQNRYQAEKPKLIP